MADILESGRIEIRGVVAMIADLFGRWRSVRDEQHRLTEITELQSRHLRDDIGLKPADHLQRIPVYGEERHRFWML